MDSKTLCYIQMVALHQVVPIQLKIQ
uniref:Uncharacterized protein n=1 Tax=Arundo donax TaxID=35708 RepID=A0A0A8Z9W5_ARUDO